MHSFKQAVIGMMAAFAVSAPVFAFTSVNNWLNPPPFIIPAHEAQKIIDKNELKKPIDIFAHVATAFMPTKELTISPRGIQFIIGKEGFKPEPYRNDGDRYTIGYGNTYWFDGRAITKNTPKINEETARRLFHHHIQENVEKYLKKCIKVPVTQDMWDAVVSLTYNIGSGAACDSTAVKVINKGDLTSLEAAFALHHRGAGKDGLLAARRSKEAQLAISVLYKAQIKNKRLAKN